MRATVLWISLGVAMDELGGLLSPLFVFCQGCACMRMNERL